MNLDLRLCDNAFDGGEAWSRQNSENAGEADEQREMDEHRGNMQHGVNEQRALE